jgi:hypothetical protein
MKTLRTVFSSPLIHLLFLTTLQIVVFTHTNIAPADDHFNYQRFIESLAVGKLDFSIPGFQGASFFAVFIYLFNHSSVANILFQLFCGALLPVMAYFAASSLFRDRNSGLLFAYIIALMPFGSFIGFRGFTFPSFTFFLFLAIALRARGSVWAWLPWGISMLIKPFSVALLPLFLLWHPHRTRVMRTSDWMQCFLALLIPACYVALQYWQIGRVIVGSHMEIDQTNVFVLSKFPLNLAHGIQMLFSIHNYYFLDPAKTSAGNLVHSSPLLMFLGVFSFLYPADRWKDRKLLLALGLSFLMAYILAALLDHMDHWYMETSVLLLVLLAIPCIAEYLLLLPLLLITLHFQFLYLYLMWRGTYFPDFTLFVIPLAIDAMALLMWFVFMHPARSISSFLRQYKLL